MSNELIQIKNLVKKEFSFSNDYSELKDLLDDNLELISDSVKVLNLLRRGYSQLKFKSFLKGFNIENPEDGDIKRLIDYIDNKEKSEFIASTFDKILTSNSKIACYIMGLLFNEISKDNRNIEQSDLVLINALSRMNDYDIENFVHLFSIIQCNNNYDTLKITDGMKSKLKVHYNVSDLNLYLSLNTMFNVGLLETRLYDINDEGNFSIHNFDSSYFFNLLSAELYKYAKKIVDNI